MHQIQFGASVGGPIARDRTFFFANVEQRRLDQIGPGDDSPTRSVSTINARLAAVGYPGPPVTTGVYPNPVDTTHFVGKIDHQFVGRATTSICATACTTRPARTRAAPAARTRRPRRPGSTTSIRRSRSATFGRCRRRMVLETRGQFAHSDLKAPPTDPIGPAVSISGVATFGTLSGSPTGRVGNDVSGRQQPVVSGRARTRYAAASTCSTTICRSRSRDPFAAATRSRRSRTSWRASTTTPASRRRSATPSVAQTNPNVGFYVQDEWRVTHASRSTPACATTCSLWRRFRPTATTSRRGSAWSGRRSRRGALLVRASAGRFYDRVPLRALANALLSAGNTTDLAKLRQTGVSLSPAQTGAPVFPNILARPCRRVDARQLHDDGSRTCRTRYSNQASVEVERQIGARSTVSVGYEHLRRPPVDHADQPERADLRGVRQQQRLPAESALRQQQSVLVGRAAPITTALHVSFVQRPAEWGSYRVVVHVLEVDEQRRRGVLQRADRSVRSLEGLGPLGRRPAASARVSGTINSPMTPATTAWERSRTASS